MMVFGIKKRSTGEILKHFTLWCWACVCVTSWLIVSCSQTVSREKLCDTIVIYHGWKFVCRGFKLACDFNVHLMYQHTCVTTTSLQSYHQPDLTCLAPKSHLRFKHDDMTVFMTRILVCFTLCLHVRRTPKWATGDCKMSHSPPKIMPNCSSHFKASTQLFLAVKM